MVRKTTRGAVLTATVVMFSFMTAPADGGGSTRATAPAAALPALRGEAWLRIETPDFTLFGNVPEAGLAVIAARLEAFRGALEWLHPGTRSSPRETSVYVFKDAASGLRYTPAASGGGHRLGVHPPYDVPNYVTVAAPVDDPPLDALYHAYAHQFLDDNFPRLPLSVVEGLADFYSGFTSGPEGTLIGLRNSAHVLWLREHAAQPLSSQLALDARSAPLADPAGRATFMAGSWLLMHYLVSGSGEQRARVPAFLEGLRRGRSPGDAASTAFGMTLDLLEEQLTQYLHHDRFLPIRIRADQRGAAASPDAGGIRSHPMRREEVLAALGEVLAHAEQGRGTDAETHLREALRLDPDQPRAYAGLGYLRYAQERFTEAVPLLERAIAIEPDAMSCYLLAKCLLKTNVTSAPATPGPPAAGEGAPPWLSRSRGLLAQAIALRPRFAAPYVVLGATHIRPDGDAATGIDLLQKAHSMLPARMDIVGNLVYLLLREGDLVRAQALVDGVLAHGGDEEALRSARVALATFKEHLEARQSLYRTRETPAEKAQWEAYKAKEVKRLRDELARTRDPEARARLEELIKKMEAPPPIITYNKAVEIYNEAVDRANQRDYARAIALLENLLSTVEEKDLRETIQTTLERFRRDSSRLQQPVE